MDVLSLGYIQQKQESERNSANVSKTYETMNYHQWWSVLVRVNWTLVRTDNSLANDLKSPLCLGGPANPKPIVAKKWNFIIARQEAANAVLEL